MENGMSVRIVVSKLFLQAPWESKEQFDDRCEAAQDRADTIAEQREDFRERVAQLLGGEK